MKVVIAGVDVTDFSDITQLTPNDDDLGEQLGTANITLEEESDLGALLAREPRYKDAVEIYDDDVVTLRLGGYLATRSTLPRPGLRRAWGCSVQDYNVRTLEAATGSLNRIAITTNDRQHVIAIFTDAFSGQTFGAGTALADAIWTANEAAGWPYVQATAFLYGKDWSYMSAKAAMDSLTEMVPNVSWRIGPDRILKYGLLRGERAPFDLHTAPGGALDYANEVLADAPLAYWRLGEAAGSPTALDASGNGRDATYNNTPTLAVPGGSDDGDTAVRFDGVNEDATTAVFNYALADPNRCTIEAIVRTTVAHSGTNRDTAYSANDAGAQPQLELGGNGGSNKVCVIIPGVFIAQTFAEALPPDGRDHHIVYTRRGVGATHEIWVDGVSLALEISGVNGFTNGGSAKRIGSRTVAAQFFDGVIDEVAFYGADLPAERIAAHYAAMDPSRLRAYEDWTEEERTVGHVNKMRRGGAGAAEETFFDEVSYQRTGHLIIDEPYADDPDADASDLRRRTYAEGKGLRIRRTASTVITAGGVKAGQVIYVANQRLGNHRNIDHGAPMVNGMKIMGRTRSGKMAQGARGRFLVQRVSRRPLGAGQHEYTLQLGDAKRDFATQLAVLSGSTE